MEGVAGILAKKPIDFADNEPMGFLIEIRWHLDTNTSNKLTGYRSNCHFLYPTSHCPTCRHCGVCSYYPICRPTAWCHYPTYLRCCHPMMNRCRYQQTSHYCYPAGYYCCPTTSLSLTAAYYRCPVLCLSLTDRQPFVTKTSRPILNRTTIGRIPRRLL